ncbi:hypothetical protein J132_10538 [Termitomyces sp. J132]|nr:hypothetical protein J132_10538 [Termitomyces sp. J132]
MDITAVHFAGKHGNLSLFNIYNDCTHNKVLTLLSLFLSSSIHLMRPLPGDHMLWVGDFNHHHPLWEMPYNKHLNFSREYIQLLLDLLADHNMELTLPPGIPTFQSLADNWTRPDNIWQSHANTDPIIFCDVDVSLRPSLADHLPVITKVELSIPRSPTMSAHDFHSADWRIFHKALTERLHTTSLVCLITSKAEFHEKVADITVAIQEVIATDTIVPLQKPCLHRKWWWNNNLKWLKAQRQHACNQAYKFRNIPDHLAKVEVACLSREMDSSICEVKEDHWKEWLDTINACQIYLANKYAVRKPTNFAYDRVPDLKMVINGTDTIVSTNAGKAKALAESFFPPPLLPFPPG